MSDSPELLKPSEVTDKELQNDLSNLISELQNENQQLRTELGNLKAENENLRADYAALLESSTHVTNKLRQEVQELRSQLEVQKTSWNELREELENSETIRGEVQAELTAVRSELTDLKQKSAAASELPEAADLLNQLKTRRKKSSASLADIEAILEMIEES